MRVVKLKNIVQDFAWGSKRWIPEFLGYENAAKKPQAELWMGIHPRGESKCLVNGELISLSEFIGRSKAEILGPRTLARFKNLPFLFKLLAAGQPLSIQAHPSKKEAQEGFARENSLNIALSAPNRNYKDANHKPEITLALSKFTALCGFRSLDEIRANLAAIAPKLPYTSLKDFFVALMTLEEEELRLIIAASKDLRLAGKELELSWVAKLQDLYPNDIASLAPLYLNLLVLEPGEAIFVKAGILHAYLEGLAMELMANSDNVLRGGLTPKHKDLAELNKVLSFAATKPETLSKKELDTCRAAYLSPAAEFSLEEWRLMDNIKLAAEHPVMIAFVKEGLVKVADLELKRGESCFIPAATGELSISGAGSLYVARANEI